MITDEYVVAGSGSRSLQTAPLEVKRAAADLVTARLVDLHAERGDFLIVMSGMALGFDKLLAVTAIKLGIPLWVAIPNRSYGQHYWRDQYADWARIVDAAYRRTYVMEDVHGINRLYLNGRHANFIRNDYLVEQAHNFLVWGPVKPKSGTADCVASIKKAGKWRDDMMLTLEPAQASLGFS